MMPTPTVPARTVLVTGYPNHVATRVIDLILVNEPEARIHLLARGDAAARAQGRFVAAEVRKRVTIHVGEVAADDLGLTRDASRRLLDTVTDIYHFASSYHIGSAKQQLEEINIQGTRNALRFAQHCRSLERLNHWSTAWVAGDRSGVILEDELEKGQHFRSTYERTRFTAELEVRRHMPDLPISVYRGSLVVGDSQSGEIEATDGPWFFMHMLVNSPSRIPQPDETRGCRPLHLVPIDYATNATYSLSLSPLARGRTFHIVDPNPFSVDQVWRMVAEAAQRQRVETGNTRALWRRAAEWTGVDRWISGSRSSIQEIDSPCMFNAMNTAQVLHPLGVFCPTLPEYLPRLVDFARRSERHTLAS
jgi:thioester reductase-like protein